VTYPCVLTVYEHAREVTWPLGFVTQASDGDAFIFMYMGVTPMTYLPEFPRAGRTYVAKSLHEWLFFAERLQKADVFGDPFEVLASQEPFELAGRTYSFRTS